MRLTKETVANITAFDSLSVPSGDLFSLPEKVLQFGTGVLLRGLPDYYIDNANKAGVFNGRIVVVKSTGGSVAEFEAQDNLYTQFLTGIEDGQATKRFVINAAISRTLSATQHWKEILDCAANPAMQIIISNTTEVGIALDETDYIADRVPASFPGKLLAFLYRRYKAFNGSEESGFVIIPTELIVDNGNKLKAILVQLAAINNLEEGFIKWLTEANDFCSSLVDRIVPGALPKEEATTLEENFGYTDDLAIMSEIYSLWAIETKSERTVDLLSFAQTNKEVIVTGNIDKYRELKLRLLNGTHTYSCGLAYLAGFNIVSDVMRNAVMYDYIKKLMTTEISPCIINGNISLEEAQSFAANVLDRFSNPYIQHKWISITMQYTGKMKMRNVPLLLKHYQDKGTVPQHMAAGFAAYILFSKPVIFEDGKYYGTNTGARYHIQYDKASYLFELWQYNTPEEVTQKVLSDTTIWGSDINQLPAFTAAVQYYMRQFLSGEFSSVLIGLAETKPEAVNE
jgi:tagaturonate reductase